MKLTEEQYAVMQARLSGERAKVSTRGPTIVNAATDIASGEGESITLLKTRAPTFGASAGNPKAINLLPGAPKPRKYRNQPAVVDGKRFDSKLEAEFYQRLVLLWKAGEVLWFVRQVPFDLPGGRRYRADFVAITRTGADVYDCKGTDTPMSKLKRDQVEELYGVRIILITRRDVQVNAG